MLITNSREENNYESDEKRSKECDRQTHRVHSIVEQFRWIRLEIESTKSNMHLSRENQKKKIIIISTHLR